LTKRSEAGSCQSTKTGLGFHTKILWDNRVSAHKIEAITLRLNMMSVRSFIRIFIALMLLNVSEAGKMCPLCGSVFNYPKRWDYPVISSPYTTCRDIYFELGAMSITDPQCHSAEHRKYQAVCCNDEIPPGWDKPPTPAPVSETGNEPTCRICKTDEYPGKPNTFISARYVGSYTCGSLYHRGRNGLIPDFMCG
jgi:hypothetical protein